MFQTGDIVSTRQGRESKLYDTDTFSEGVGTVSGFWLEYRAGVVTVPRPDTPTGHYVVVYNYNPTSTMVTIPAQDLWLQARNDMM